MVDVPIKGYTPVDLGKYGEMLGRVLARPGLDKDPEVTLRANDHNHPVVDVIVELLGRNPLRITLEEIRPR